MEPRPVYDLSESDIQAQCVEALRAAGWFVTVTSQDRGTRQQLSGLPDLICVKQDRVLFVEVKAMRGRLRQSQRDFFLALQEHTGMHVDGFIVRCVEDLEPVLANWGNWPS